MDRFKSVLVEGKGNPLQTMAAYIDLNPVRAGLVEDPKDYRFCGYAEAVAGSVRAGRGISAVWVDRSGGSGMTEALSLHRMLLFGKGSSPWTHAGKLIDQKEALKVLNEQQGCLPMSVVLRCRVRYFTDGVILGSEEFVRGMAVRWQADRGRSYLPKVKAASGGDWGDLAVIASLRRCVFG